MKQEGIITRINSLMEKEADNPNSFSKKIGIDPSGFRKKMKGETPIMPKDIKKICEAFGVSKEWLEEGKGDIYINGNVNICSNKTMRDMKLDSDTAYHALKRLFDAPHSERKELDNLCDIIFGNNPYELDIPMEVIGRSLGHSLWDNAVTATYIKYDTRKIDEANRMVIDYLNEDIKREA